MTATDNELPKQETALVKAEQKGLMAPPVFAMLERQADFIAQSRLMSGIDTKAKAITLILQGHELGLSPMQALRGVDIIQGKPVIKPQLMAAMIVNNGHPRPRTLERTAQKAKIAFYHSGEKEPTIVEYTIEEAKQAGLAGKDNWRNYPADMLWNRCMSRGARQEYPELFFSVYGPGELTDETQPDYYEAPASTGGESEVVEGQVVEEVNPHLYTAREIEAKTGILTMKTSGAWISGDQLTFQRAAQLFLGISDPAEIARQIGVEKISDAVKERYPTAKGPGMWSAAIHFIYEWQKAQPETPEVEEEF